jgi:hypothetical protein
MDLLPFFIVGFVILDLCILAFVFWWRSKRGLSDTDLEQILSYLHKVELETDQRQKILEMDKLLDLTLSKLGFVGTLGDKLKKAGPRFTNLDALWSAHKLRNRIAHEAGFMPSSSEVKVAFAAFRKALEDLGVR